MEGDNIYIHEEYDNIWGYAYRQGPFAKEFQRGTAFL